jgi:4-hydroxybenzoate polyprenyltransferase
MSRPLEIAHLIIALAAAACTAATLATGGFTGIDAVTHPMTWWIGALAGWTYTAQRWIKWRRNPDELPAPRRAAFDRDPWAGLLVWTAVALAATCTLLAHRPPHWSTFLPVAAGAGALALGYALLPRPGGEGLRALPGAKLPVIALTWAAATIALPLSAEGLDMHWVAFAGQTCFIAGLTLPFDIRDLAQDPPHLRTIPQVFGPHTAIRIALLLLALAAALFVLAPQPQWTRMFVAVAAMPAVAVGVVPRKETYYTWVLDGLITLQILGILGN